ncbi:hypothetical protein [Caudoviricetes sp.]|nr:hypothetical protein [Caudoviricetes sp.]
MVDPIRFKGGSELVLCLVPLDKVQAPNGPVTATPDDLAELGYVPEPPPSVDSVKVEYASPAIWEQLRGLYEIAKRAWSVRTCEGGEGDLDAALQFYVDTAMPAHLERMAKAVPFPTQANGAQGRAGGGEEQRWAVECLDAWAVLHGYNVPQVQRELRDVDGIREWSVFVQLGDERRRCVGHSPNDARIAAARALYAADPSLPAPPSPTPGGDKEQP